MTTTEKLHPGQCREIHIGPAGEVNIDFVSPIAEIIAKWKDDLEDGVGDKMRDLRELDLEMGCNGNHWMYLLIVGPIDVQLIAVRDGQSRCLSKMSRNQYVSWSDESDGSFCGSSQ